MPARAILPALTAISLCAVLAGCVGAAPAPSSTPTSAPIGPVAPPEGPLTLDAVRSILSIDDVPPTTLLNLAGTSSTAEADLASERDYWVSVGGSPDQCADVVAAPYLVSSNDVGTRLDDPSLLIGTVTEVDEERFGLVQLYGRQFDDPATAAGFLDEFTAFVDACPAYQLNGYDAVDLSAKRLTGSDAVAGIEYREKVSDSDEHTTTVYFLQRDSVMVSIYAELFESSTITAADVDRIADDVTERMAIL